MALRITEVREDSIAWELGIQPGDILTHIGGQPCKDAIDFLYFEARDQVELNIRKPDGEILQAEVEKDESEPLGLAFEEDGFPHKRSCANKCMFCFIDQLPKGMRQTLYFKDDDWRMSFVMGNYITLTNVSEAEFERILRRKTSPLYISVHAADDAVRARLLHQERGRGIIQRLKRLAEAGISFHCQAVIAPGINDGEVLEETIRQLAMLRPYALSLALVPVGMTKHREGLAPLKPMDERSAFDILRIVQKWQKKLQIEGGRFVFAADELYIRAGQELPSYEEYEGFEQLEDGVGMVRSFVSEVKWALEEAQGKKSPYQTVSVATGVDFYPYLQQAAKDCERQLNVRIQVYPVKNDFFGHTITVTGLLTARDIAAQLKGKELGERLLLARNMLRDRRDVFLDDVTIDQMCDIMGVTCQPVGSDGYGFVAALLGQNEGGE